MGPSVRVAAPNMGRPGTMHWVMWRSRLLSLVQMEGGAGWAGSTLDSNDGSGSLSLYPLAFLLSPHHSFPTHKHLWGMFCAPS